MPLSAEVRHLKLLPADRMRRGLPDQLAFQLFTNCVRLGDDDTQLVALAPQLICQRVRVFRGCFRCRRPLAQQFHMLFRCLGIPAHITAYTVDTYDGGFQHVFIESD